MTKVDPTHHPGASSNTGGQTFCWRVFLSYQVFIWILSTAFLGGGKKPARANPHPENSMCLIDSHVLFVWNYIFQRSRVKGFFLQKIKGYILCSSKPTWLQWLLCWFVAAECLYQKYSLDTESAAHPCLLSNYEIKHDSYPKHRSGMQKANRTQGEK